MVQQGIQSLMPQQAPMPGQAPQAPMPGQAPQAPMPGMMPKPSAATPGALTGSLKSMPLEQLKMLYQNPQPTSPPLWAVITALAEKQKEAQALQAAMGQSAMAQNAQMQQQPPVAAQVVRAAEQMQQPVMAASGGIMQGYAGGGAVAFGGGGNPEIEQILKKSPLMRTPEENEKLRAAGVDLVKRQPAPEGSGVSAFNKALESPFLRSVFSGGAYTLSPEELAARSDTGALTEKLFRGFGGQQYVEPPIASSGPAGTRQGKSGIADLDIGPSIAPAPRPPGATRPGTGIAQSRPQNRPQAAPAATGQGLGSFVEQTGTPAPDRLAEIEAGGIANIKALQDVIRQQGTVDPELMKLREAAYKSSQDIAARRERDRQAMLEAGQKQYDDISDLLIGAAGGAKGKTFGEVLSGAVGGAGAARTAKRAEFQKVKELSRQEQNAIDTLNQALADKRVADRSGDVNQQRQADLKVAEAQMKVTDLGMSVQKERATEADRAEQRRLTARGQDLQRQTTLEAARIGAAARESASDIAEKRLALQQLRADPEYAAAMNKIKELSKAAGMSSSPTVQAAFKAAQQEALTIAKRYGLTPQDIGAAAPAAPAGNDPLGIRK